MDEPTLFPLPPSLPPAPSAPAGVGPRVQQPNRIQVEWRPVALDHLLPPDHRARLVWRFVEQLHLAPLYARIEAVAGAPGRPPIDPAILMGLWLYATLEGVGSARALDRLCSEHVAYQWLCGGVSVNYHTLADFRVQHTATLDELLTQSVAALLHAGVVDLSTVTQDGYKVRASAGASSFRRRATLQQCLRTARRQVRRLRREVERDPGAVTRRQQAAQERAAQEREERARAALAHVATLAQAKQAQRSHNPREPRASSTDPEARVMKLSDGGYRPAYNLQFARALEAPIVVGVAVTNAGCDFGQLPPMLAQVQARYGRTPATVVTDGGFAKMADLVTLSAPPYACTVIAPVQKPRKRGQDPYAPRPGDPPAVRAWRERMATPAAQALLRQRPGAAEWVNAQVSNRGLRRVVVRGLAKVRAVALWHALAINLLQGSALRAAAAAAAAAT